MPRPPACRPARLGVALGLGLALTGLAALPVRATPVPQGAAPGVAPLVLPDPQPVPVAETRAPRPAPRPAADAPGSESLWFVGVFQ
jgi:hypothetical protein